jgi:proteasome lid subunit RPN8/RPN11
VTNTFKNSYWHSCPHCFPHLSEEDVMGTGERVGDIWDRNAAKAAAIREEMELRVVWEHE